MIYSVKSTVGRIRQNNQDSFHIPRGNDDIALFIVADGMGGTNGGELASSIAISSICSYVKDNFDESNDISVLLRDAVAVANRAIYRTGRMKQEYSRMGTTVTMAMIVGDLLYIAHVGDSRAYIYNNGNMRQITVDHSYVQELVSAGQITPQEAKSHPERHKITRAVGINGFVSADIFIEHISNGDRILICSDGLTTMIDDSQIQDILSNEAIPKNAVSKLVNAAETAGGNDNITVIIIDMD